jgi:hypothetical protein
MTMRDLKKLVFEVTERSEQWRVLGQKTLYRRGEVRSRERAGLTLKSKWRRLEDWFSPEKPWQRLNPSLYV